MINRNDKNFGFLIGSHQGLGAKSTAIVTRADLMNIKEQDNIIFLLWNVMY